MKKMKYMLGVMLLGFAPMTYAQFVLSDFDNISAASEYQGFGTISNTGSFADSMGFVEDGNAPGIVSVNSTDTGGAVWFFDGETTNIFNTQFGLGNNYLELSGVGIAGTGGFTGITVEFYDDTLNNIYTLTFSAAEINSATEKLITDPLLNVAGFGLKYSGGPGSFTGGLDTLQMVSAIPEPSTYTLLALGAGALALLRRRKASAKS